MTSEQFITKCREELCKHYSSVPGQAKIKVQDTYVVWYCKSLQNHKALLSTNVSGDGAYYEFTYNGDKSELYMDAYKKQSNTCIKC